MHIRRVQVLVLALASLASQITLLPNAFAIYNGTSALGNSHVVKMTTSKGACSGTLVEPQLVVTAAHCLVESGVEVPLDSVRIYPPGVDTSKGTTVYGALAIYYPPGFYNSTTVTDPNDIAFVVLNARVDQSQVLLLASFDVVQKILASGSPIYSFGYGATTSGGYSPSTPMMFQARQTTQRRLRGYQGYERTYISYLNDVQGATCPGDSGGPAIAKFNGLLYLVSVHSGGLGPCSRDPERTGWGATATIPGEYLGLYDRAKLFITTLKPSSISNPKISSVGMSATISWDPANQSSVQVTGYLVKDQFNGEICRTQTDSCEISLKVGLNSFVIYALAGQVMSEGLSLQYTTQNASMPSFLGADIYRTSAVIRWDTEIEFGNALPSETIIEVLEVSSGEVLCREVVELGECRFIYQLKSYQLQFNIISNIGREVATSRERFSGISSSSLVTRVINNRESLSKRINSWLISNPGYQPELALLARELPLLDDSFIYSEEKLQQISNVGVRMSELGSQIASNPRKVSITCAKGKISKVIKAIKPVCPAGYKLR